MIPSNQLGRETRLLVMHLMGISRTDVPVLKFIHSPITKI